MKYSQACILKKQVDSSIDKLMKNLMGLNLTNAVRVRLAVAHVSIFKMRVLALAKMDADNINLYDNDRKLWVHVMAQTLNTGLAEEDRGYPPMGPATPPRQMTIYMVQENQDGLAEQASTPVVMPILTPQMKGWVIIKANLGQGESPREEEMTMDKDGEREMSKPREPSEAQHHHMTGPPK